MSCGLFIDTLIIIFAIFLFSVCPEDVSKVFTKMLGNVDVSMKCKQANILGVHVWGVQSGSKLEWSSKISPPYTSIKLESGFAVRVLSFFL